MEDAQFRASQAAIPDQQAAGVDVLNGGEMNRRTNNRHAPPNAAEVPRCTPGRLPEKKHASERRPLADS